MELLEFVEVAFDAVAQLVQRLIVVPLLFAVGARRNHCFGSHRLFYKLDNLVRVVAFVSDHGLSLVLTQQLNRGRVIADLPASEQEIQWQTQFVDQQVNVGRQSTSGTPQSLVAPFLRPVAACW